MTPYRPRELRFQVFRGREAIESLVLTAGQLRSDAWVRLDHDVYADSRLESDHDLACRAAALRLPPEAAFAGPSAAYLLGVAHAARASDPVHVVVPPSVRLPSRSRVRVHHVELSLGDVDSTSGLPRTSPARTVWDLSAWMAPTSSVPIIDSLLGLGVVDLEALNQYIVGRQAQRGFRRAGHAVALADGRAQSAPESVLRVRLMLAGLPRPVVQLPVMVGSITLHPDLAWPEYLVAIEYDGQWHDEPGQMHRDRRRLNKLVAAGWAVLHVTSERLRRDFRGVVAEARATLRARGWPG
jgi:very-short-patch-repair endonuclease